MKKIIAALDLQQQTHLVIEKAIELADKFGSELHLIHVVAPLGVYMGTAVADPLVSLEPILLPNELDLMDNSKHIAEEQLKKISEDLNRTGVVTSVLLGTIEEEVVQYVREHNADLLVIGAHWHRGLFRLLNGETSVKILHETPIPILIVPTGAISKRGDV